MPIQSPSDFSRAARLFHALSDEARVEIVSVLMQGEHCVCDLMTHVGAAQSRLSYHLKVLKDAGLVTDRREGRWSYYALQRDVIEEALHMLESLRPRGKRATLAGCCG
ncbi:MAG: metalloregulator ArsR/SmtB family transcription factor [Gemmatimonadaceae bacterium]|nr:metalloregulator ArsR/SmtB family transcription factor [Gemmatimonadaceae bacterium]